MSRRKLYFVDRESCVEELVPGPDFFLSQGITGHKGCNPLLPGPQLEGCSFGWYDDDSDDRSSQASFRVVWTMTETGARWRFLPMYCSRIEKLGEIPGLGDALQDDTMPLEKLISQLERFGFANGRRSEPWHC